MQEKMDRLILCYFVMVIRGWGRLISGNTRYRGGDPRSLTTWHFSSLVIDHFYGSGKDITVAGLYCDYLDRKEQTTSNMLGAMLKQLVGRGNIPEDIRKAFEDAKDHFGGVRPQVPQVVNMLKTAIGQRQRVVICIDGLDESLPIHRAGLLKSLRAIAQEMPNVRLFLTGRPFISGEVEKHFPDVHSISVSPTKEDTKAFLKIKLGEDSEPEAMDENLRADIMEIIPKTISEMYILIPSVPMQLKSRCLRMIMHRFLLVSLSIEAILAEPTIHRRKERLKQMSKGQGVGDVYGATLERIKGQEEARSRLGMEAIMWIAYSERPLKPDELCQALGVEVGSGDLNKDNTPNIRTIIRCGLGLVTVDSSSSTVRLVHFTLQEHILANPIIFQSPHSVIVEACLTYLNFSYIMGLSPTLSSPPPAAPFLEYASCYWGVHARRGISEKAIPLALKLLDRFDRHISCKLLLLKQVPWKPPLDIEGSPIGFTGLHGGALLGVLEPMVSLFDIKKWDLNATDLGGCTALTWAARKGHDGDVKVLLEQVGLHPDIPDNMGRTPLFWASLDGHCEIVKMLFEQKNVNPDTADHWGQTPLSHAAACGRKEVVEVLLQRSDINPNTVDKRGDTPLSWAIIAGRNEIVEILLQRNDVNPDVPDKNGRTPLSLAAERGQQVMAEMLLEKSNVNPDAPDKSGRTPLSWAAQSWQVEIVRILLERNDVNPDIRDERGRTAFSWAAGGCTEAFDDDPDVEGEIGQGESIWDTKNRCGRTVEILLEQNYVNPDIADKNGRTPLSWAASHGNAKVVKMLLERNDVNPETLDRRSRTPNLWAVIYDHKEVVEILLEQNGINPDMADESGRTPLSWAVTGEQEGIVEMLLGRGDVNPDRADHRGRTPLLFAAEYGYREGVEMLLKRNDVNPGRADVSGRTPLSWASRKGYEEILEMLSERNNINPATAGGSGQAPSPGAAGRGYERVSEMPLQWSDVNLGRIDESGSTLSWSTETGYRGVVGLVSQRSDVTSDLGNMGVQSQLSHDTIFGHDETVDMLWEQHDISPDPIPATGSGYEGDMGILLEWNHANRDTADEIGGMPFPWAPGGASEAIPEILFEQNNDNPNPASPFSQTPFPWAAENEYARVSQLVEGPYDPFTQLPFEGGFSEPFISEPSEIPEPPLKRLRRL